MFYLSVHLTWERTNMVHIKNRMTMLGDIVDKWDTLQDGEQRILRNGITLQIRHPVESHSDTRLHQSVPVHSDARLDGITLLTQLHTLI